MNIDLTQESISIAQTQAELDQRKEAIAAEQRKRLAAEHKVIVGEARVAKDEFEKLAAEADELQRQTFRTRNACENAERSLANHRASEPKASSYPTDEEMAIWRRELKRREAAVTRANESDGVAVRALLTARMARNISDERLQRLADREADMREKLAPPGPRPFLTSKVSANGFAII